VPPPVRVHESSFCPPAEAEPLVGGAVGWGKAQRANLGLVDVIKAVAERKGVTVGQVALAWLLAHRPATAILWRAVAAPQNAPCVFVRSIGLFQSRVLGATSRTITQLPWPLGRS
jgi:hypothetical protein